MFAMFVKNRHINKMELTYTPIEGDGPEVVRPQLRLAHINVTDVLSLVHFNLYCEVSVRWPACNKCYSHDNYCLPGH
jgi:tRNA G37 N-methylase Trm5